MNARTLTSARMVEHAIIKKVHFIANASQDLLGKCVIIMLMTVFPILVRMEEHVWIKSTDISVSALLVILVITARNQTSATGIHAKMVELVSNILTIVDVYVSQGIMDHTVNMKKYVRKTLAKMVSAILTNTAIIANVSRDFMERIAKKKITAAPTPVKMEENVITMNTAINASARVNMKERIANIKNNVILTLAKMVENVKNIIILTDVTAKVSTTENIANIHHLLAITNIVMIGVIVLFITVTNSVNVRVVIMEVAANMEKKERAEKKERVGKKERAAKDIRTMILILTLMKNNSAHL